MAPSIMLMLGLFFVFLFLLFVPMFAPLLHILRRRFSLLSCPILCFISSYTTPEPIPAVKLQATWSFCFLFLLLIGRMFAVDCSLLLFALLFFYMLCLSFSLFSFFTFSSLSMCKFILKVVVYFLLFPQVCFPKRSWDKARAAFFHSLAIDLPLESL